MLSLDTHMFIAAVEGSLRRDEQLVLENDYWAISDIVLWELSVLDRQRKISIRLGDSRVRRVIDVLTIMPITFEVAQTLHRLDFRSDPADEIIAATSIVNDAPLVTRDARILSSKIVPFAGR